MRVAVVVFLAGIVPWLTTMAATYWFGSNARVNEPLHELFEVAGSCLAISVSLLLILQAQHDPGEEHLAWVSAALLGMGLLDMIHAMLPFGLAWSWLRHGATLAGGLLFALVWVRPPRELVLRLGAFGLSIAAGAVAIGVTIWADRHGLPAVWSGRHYLPMVKLVNAAGGLGFLSATVFFLRRYVQKRRGEDVVFASHTLLFATAALLFGFSHTWGADWWTWHGFRLLAYGIVCLVAYRAVQVLYSDITQGKVDLEERVRERTAELQQSRAKLAAFVEATFEGIAETSDGIIVDCNEQFARMTGWTVAELKGKKVAELVVPEDRVRVSGNIQVNRNSVEEHGVLRKDGTRIVVEARGRQGRGGDGRRFTAIRDITERKRAEEALRESESRAKVAQAVELERRRFYAVLETLPAMVCLLTPDYRVAFANRSFREKFGEGEGRHCYEQCFRLTQPCSFCESYTVLKTGQPHHWETRGLDGSIIDVHDFPFTDVDGSPMILEMCLDITEFRRIQAELKSANEILEERRAKLQELVGDLEHFSYSITHDLKSPLRAMRGFAEMASMACEEGEREKSKEFLERIATAAERMDRLIADALNYSRAVRQELPLEDVNAGSLLRGILDSYPEFQPENAHIQVEGRLPAVLANEAGLTQCFSNLLSNAVKFVRWGDKADVRVWAVEREGWVRIWVADKGIGISKLMLPRIFNMFARGSKDYEGTGIGLALVKKVVQRMGGRVGVESEEGTGSRFWIELKGAEAKASRTTITPALEADVGEGSVLYVEDEEGDALFMKMAFERKGMGAKLRRVPDGRAAIDYLSGAGDYANREQFPVPALVLLDLNLPQVPGFAVLEWVRNNPDFAQTPVVIFSSSTREEDRVRAQQLGANEFVSKPSSGLKFGDVVEALRRKWLVTPALKAGL